MTEKTYNPKKVDFYELTIIRKFNKEEAEELIKRTKKNIKSGYIR